MLCVAACLLAAAWPARAFDGHSRVVGLAPARAACVMGAPRSRAAGANTGRRSSRVGQVVRNELASLISGGNIHHQRNPLKEQIRQMISVVDVTVTDDMRTAKVRVSTLGEKLDGLRAIRWLQDNRKSLRYELAQRLTHMRRVPELTFVDIDISSPVRVMALIDKLAAEAREVSAAREASEDGDDTDELDTDELDFGLDDDEDDLDFDWADKTQ